VQLLQLVANPGADQVQLQTGYAKNRGTCAKTEFYVKWPFNVIQYALKYRVDGWAGAIVAGGL